MKTRLEYIQELRRKSLWIIITTIIIGIICFIVSPTLIQYLLNYYGIEAINLSPAESISTSLVFSFGIAMLFLVPAIFLQLFNFSKELIPKIFHKEIILKTIIGTIFAIVGFTIGITFFGKLILNGLMIYNIGTPLWSLSSILKTTAMFGLTIAIAIQMVWFVPLSIKTEIMKRNTLKSIRPYLLIGLLILSALITPPDAISMGLMMLPLYGSFELGLLLSYFNKNEIKKVLNSVKLKWRNLYK